MIIEARTLVCDCFAITGRWQERFEERTPAMNAVRGCDSAPAGPSRTRASTPGVGLHPGRAAPRARRGGAARRAGSRDLPSHRTGWQRRSRWGRTWGRQRSTTGLGLLCNAFYATSVRRELPSTRRDNRHRFEAKLKGAFVIGSAFLLFFLENVFICLRPKMKK